MGWWTKMMGHVVGKKGARSHDDDLVQISAVRARNALAHSKFREEKCPDRMNRLLDQVVDLIRGEPTTHDRAKH